MKSAILSVSMSAGKLGLQRVIAMNSLYTVSVFQL